MKPKRRRKRVTKSVACELASHAPEGAEIQRYNLRERLIHWTVATSFLYLLLSGLALYSPRLYWISSLLGGGTNTRIWHPYAGVVFFLAVSIMTVNWRRCLWLYPEDWEWMRYTWSYITHGEEGVPESGRFNAGQKTLFWMQALSGLALLLSGVVLWFPDKFSWEGLGTEPQPYSPGASSPGLAGILTHEVFAIVSMGCITVHLYMGLFATPGALRAMVEGKVTEAWARTHHARWYKRVMGISL
ncbi:MAG TPA: formate dehydrogenase subunit gamma [Candidatus Tripitaka californicus]|uniref:formate dehydrogenase subunit gamma n=1 Tax=Candidatus Tripitaka californicus TaxID=3367616 RepID=UPI004026D33B|nr:formate dehydrogenase subunit gamma [Planctomycetota bacterium]